MKKRLIKNVSVFMFAAVIGISSFSMITKAEASMCYLCEGYNISLKCEVERFSVDYVNPSVHLVYAEREYHCKDCKQSITFEEYFEEWHSYDLVEASGLMRCVECGDSYYAY